MFVERNFADNSGAHGSESSSIAPDDSRSILCSLKQVSLTAQTFC